MTTTTIATIANLATFLRPDLAGQTIDGKMFLTPEQALRDAWRVEHISIKERGEMVEFAVSCCNGRIDQADDTEETRACVRHNFASWAIAILDHLHELALVEDWKRALEAEVDVKLWPQFCLGEEHQVDWMCKVSSIQGSAEYTAIGATPNAALRSALEIAAGGMPVGLRRTTVYFVNARFHNRHAFRLATDHGDQAVKEHIARRYVAERDGIPLEEASIDQA